MYKLPAIIKRRQGWVLHQPAVAVAAARAGAVLATLPRLPAALVPLMALPACVHWQEQQLELWRLPLGCFTLQLAVVPLAPDLAAKPAWPSIRPRQERGGGRPRLLRLRRRLLLRRLLRQRRWLLLLRLLLLLLLLLL